MNYDACKYQIFPTFSNFPKLPKDTFTKHRFLSCKPLDIRQARAPATQPIHKHPACQPLSQAGGEAEHNGSISGIKQGEEDVKCEESASKNEMKKHDRTITCARGRPTTRCHQTIFRSTKTVLTHWFEASPFTLHKFEFAKCATTNSAYAKRKRKL